MFGKSLKTIADVKEHFTGMINDLEKTLTVFDQHRAEGTLAHFMHWNGFDFHEEVVKASTARSLLANIVIYEEDNISPVMQFDNVKAITLRKVNNMRIRISSRSTSPSANLEEDFENKFWIELNQKFNERY